MAETKQQKRLTRSTANPTGSFFSAHGRILAVLATFRLPFTPSPLEPPPAPYILVLHLLRTRESSPIVVDPLPFLPIHHPLPRPPLHLQPPLHRLVRRPRILDLERDLRRCLRDARRRLRDIREPLLVQQFFRPCNIDALDRCFQAPQAIGGGGLGGAIGGALLPTVLGMTQSLLVLVGGEGGMPGPFEEDELQGRAGDAKVDACDGGGRRR